MENIPCGLITPFGTWLLSLCHGFGGEQVMDRTSGFLLFYLFYQSRLGQLSFDSITGLNVQRMVERRQDLFQSPYQSAGCVPLLAPHLSSLAPMGLCLLLLGDVCERGIPSLCSPQAGILQHWPGVCARPGEPAQCQNKQGCHFLFFCLQELKIFFLPFPPGRK